MRVTSLSGWPGRDSCYVLIEREVMVSEPILAIGTQNSIAAPGIASEVMSSMKVPGL